MKTNVWVMLWILCCYACAGCGASEEETDEKETKTGDSESENAPVDTGADEPTDNGEEEEEEPIPCDERIDEILAIDHSFDEGGGDTFYMTNPDQNQEADFIYGDNGKGATIEDRDCMMLHADAMDNGGYGYSIEFQVSLDDIIDLSCEDFTISFDIYIPEETYRQGEPHPSIQWAFFESSGFTPIYSYMLPQEGDPALEPDTWTTISGTVTPDDVSYDNFPNDPDDWQVDLVRVQLVIDGESAAEGDELTFYVDNLVVKNY